MPDVGIAQAVVVRIRMDRIDNVARQIPNSATPANFGNDEFNEGRFTVVVPLGPDRQRNHVARCDRNAIQPLDVFVRRNRTEAGSLGRSRVENVTTALGAVLDAPLNSVAAARAWATRAFTLTCPAIGLRQPTATSICGPGCMARLLAGNAIPFTSTCFSVGLPPNQGTSFSPRQQSR